MPLAQFASLARLEGIRLFSLQKGPGVEELPEFVKRFPMTDFGNEFDRASGPFMDTAAVMKHLDLVVTVDTAVGHCAGALGVPVWVTMPFCPDWRWLAGRDDSPWYPTMRLFRQKRWGDWDEVFQRIVQALRKLRKDEG